MAGRLSLVALAFVAASLVFAFAPPPLDRLSNDSLLVGALALAGLGVLLGVVAMVRRQIVAGLLAVVAGLLLAFFYVASYGH